jgi:hypothetical protein
MKSPFARFVRIGAKKSEIFWLQFAQIVQKGKIHFIEYFVVNHNFSSLTSILRTHALASLPNPLCKNFPLQSLISKGKYPEG